MIEVKTLTPAELALVMRRYQRYPWDSLKNVGDYFELTKTTEEISSFRCSASITAKKRGWKIAVKTEQICPDLYQVRAIRTA